MKKLVCIVMMVVQMMCLLSFTGCSQTKKVQEEGFTPRLEKDAAVDLDIMGFFGNF